MSISTAIIVFIGSLALSAVSSIVLSESLDRLVARLGFSEGLLGIVTALAADLPEIAAAFVALSGGASDMGVGIVLGSNIFNLAALLGLSAVIAGNVCVGLQGLVFNSGAALAVTAVAAVFVCGWIPAWAALALVIAILVPYVVIASLHPRHLQDILPETALRRFLVLVVADTDEDNRKDHTPPKAKWQDMTPAVPALASIVLASIGMVNAADRIGAAVGISHAILGVLILAPLTGVPNMLAAIRLARHGRGAAVLSESLNSNSINIVAGICMPGVIVGLGAVSHRSIIAVWWLLAATAITAILTCIKGGLRRWEGWLIIAIYGAFVAAMLLIK